MSRAGKKSFEQCDVKSVIFTRRIRVFQDESRSVSKSIVLDENDVTPEQMQVSQTRGYRATLQCPRLEDDPRSSIESESRVHATQLDALESMKRLAGEVICRDCRFSSMTPVEISHERAQLATAEAERAEAYRLREIALRELNTAFPQEKQT
ncbi:MAG: hypothetical protein JWN38_1102 [Candidatus Saccharibacteria bacterium]|nr:hypothetical protein [Candidatus Saccharibacteria bacterium]